MRRNRNFKKVKLFRGSSKQRREVFNIEKWWMMVDKGIWKIPVSKQFAGEGLDWKRWVTAVEEVECFYQDYDFMSVVISHAGAIYLLQKYGSLLHKQTYLPGLIQGNIACVIFPEICIR